MKYLLIDTLRARPRRASARLDPAHYVEVDEQIHSPWRLDGLVVRVDGNTSRKTASERRFFRLRQRKTNAFPLY